MLDAAGKRFSLDSKLGRHCARGSVPVLRLSRPSRDNAEQGLDFRAFCSLEITGSVLSGNIFMLRDVKELIRSGKPHQNRM